MQTVENPCGIRKINAVKAGINLCITLGFSTVHLNSIPFQGNKILQGNRKKQKTRKMIRERRKRSPDLSTVFTELTDL